MIFGHISIVRLIAASLNTIIRYLLTSTYLCYDMYLSMKSFNLSLFLNHQKSNFTQACIWYIVHPKNKTLEKQILSLLIADPLLHGFLYRVSGHCRREHPTPKARTGEPYHGRSDIPQGNARQPLVGRPRSGQHWMPRLLDKCRCVLQDGEVG